MCKILFGKFAIIFSHCKRLYKHLQIWTTCIWFHTVQLKKCDGRLLIPAFGQNNLWFVENKQLGWEKTFRHDNSQVVLTKFGQIFLPIAKSR